MVSLGGVGVSYTPHQPHRAGRPSPGPLVGLGGRPDAVWVSELALESLRPPRNAVCFAIFDEANIHALHRGV